MLKEVHLAGSVRTPFGSFCGAFADVSAVELGKAAVERSGVKRGGRQRTPPGEHPERRHPAQTPRARSRSGGPNGHYNFN